jgi:sulfite exporter TauE/SafE
LLCQLIIYQRQKSSYRLLVYQFGRIITYSLIGLIFGLAGRRIYISGYQQWFSIGMGVLVLILAVLYFFRKTSIHISFLNRFYHSVQVMHWSFTEIFNGLLSFLLMGMANGLLPCGMVYIALAATLSLPQVSQSIAFMALFGAGTLPAMMIVGYAGQMIRPGIRRSLQKSRAGIYCPDGRCAYFTWIESRDTIYQS